MTLAFDEIRLYGVTSVQVHAPHDPGPRHPRALTFAAAARRKSNYLSHLDPVIDPVIAASPLDLQDRPMAS